MAGLVISKRPVSYAEFMDGWCLHCLQVVSPVHSRTAEKIARFGSTDVQVGGKQPRKQPRIALADHAWIEQGSLYSFTSISSRSEREGVGLEEGDGSVFVAS